MITLNTIGTTNRSVNLSINDISCILCQKFKAKVVHVELDGATVSPPNGFLLRKG